ncbi:MAG TPA: hypothetical protein VGI41_05915 [Candidatus Udaeobacter sp.]
MPEDSSNAQVPAGESGNMPGYVKNKIKSKNRPNRGSRGRKGWRGSIAKVIKKAASIAELLTEDDQEENLRVIREAKRATHRVFNFETKKTEAVPDHKTRLAGVMLDLAYREGKPVERQVQLQGDFEDLSVRLEKYKFSPEARRLLPPDIWNFLPPEKRPELGGPQEGKGSSDSEQKTG